MNGQASLFTLLSVTAIVVLGISGCKDTAESKTMQSAAAKQASRTAPYSQTIEVGDTLYLAGQGSRNPETGQHPIGVAMETRQVMLNLKRGLDAAGYTFQDVVASHVWVTDLDKYTDMNDVYASFFEGTYPTRTTVGVTALPGGSNVEIAMVAFKGDKKVIFPTGAKPGRLPFSPGILAGDTLYLSGQAGVDPAAGKLVTGDLAAHVTQTMKNIGAVLEAADMSFSDIVSAYVFLKNVGEFGAMNEAYQKFVEDPKPARVPLGAARLPLDSPVEITVIASRQPAEAVLPAGMGGSSSYSRGLKTGSLFFLAGVGAKEGTVEEQVNSCLDRIEQILEAGDLSLDDIVEARVYLADIKDYDAMNAAYRKRFSKRFPTRATVAVSRLVADLNMFMGFTAAAK